uniref:Uncharacterized protein n=1 Tax=Romanomermis culicivorax TaxID=13658 RepID=A0A915IDD4_ROMCU
MMTPSTSSQTDEPPQYQESLNINECYVGWGEQQPHQNDISFRCDGIPLSLHVLPFSFAISPVAVYINLTSASEQISHNLVINMQEYMQKIKSLNKRLGNVKLGLEE